MKQLSKAQLDRLAQTHILGEFASGMHLATRFLLRKFVEWRKVPSDDSPLGYWYREVVLSEGIPLIETHPLKVWGEYLLRTGWKLGYRHRSDIRFIRPGWKLVVGLNGKVAYFRNNYDQCPECKKRLDRRHNLSILYHHQQRDLSFSPDRKYEKPGEWVPCETCSELSHAEVERLVQLIKDRCAPPVAI